MTIGFATHSAQHSILMINQYGLQGHREVTHCCRIGFQLPKDIRFTDFHITDCRKNQSKTLKAIPCQILNNKIMKKLILALLVLCANISLIACTDDSLAEAQEEQNLPHYADEGDGHIDPPADPPGE